MYLIDFFQDEDFISKLMIAILKSNITSL